MIIDLKSFRKKYFCAIFSAIFKAVKMYFSSKFSAWISFHTAILKT